MSARTKVGPVTVAEAAEALRVSARTVLNLIHAGKLAAYRPGVGARGKFVIEVEELDRYRRSCRYGGESAGGLDHLSRRGRRS